MSSILQKIININLGGFPRRRRANPPQSKKSKYCKMSTYWDLSPIGGQIPHNNIVIFIKISFVPKNNYSQQLDRCQLLSYTKRIFHNASSYSTK